MPLNDEPENNADEARADVSGPVEILERHDSAVLSDDVDFRQRIIDVIAVPYEQEAEIAWRGETWREVFLRSAFNGIENHAGRVPVNREHVVGDTVGKVVRLDPYDDRGLLASVKIARTPRGDDTLQLASEGMLGASVGYFVKRGSDVETNRRLMLRRVKRAFLQHLAMTESPAYVGAETVSVREGLSAQPAAGKPLLTPVLDEFLSDDVLSWANTRTSRD
jgi:HK97 family phage prohead protease